ncbi:MAG: hypothetical protein AAGK00_07435 [Pseudomonadota bacterium]
MPVIMHFATFLKFLTQNTGEKIRDLEKYGEPGGFDFYRGSRDGVLAYCAHGRSRDAILRDIGAGPQNTVVRNREIFIAAADWLDDQRGNRHAPSRGVWASPNGVFSVHIEPEISLSRGRTTDVVAVYPRREPRINRDQAGAGVLLLRRAYNGNGNERFGVLDAAGRRVHWSPTNFSDAILEREIETIESELERILGTLAEQF